MKLSPLFKWFGSKWSGAKHYPNPVNDVLCEPYAGGAGYSLNHSDRQVHLWDIDPHLQVLWPWLIKEATTQLVLDIPLAVPEGTDIRTLGLSLGQATLLKSWQRTNSVGDCWTVSKWGHLPGQWTANTRARVADQVNAIKHWKFGPPSTSWPKPDVGSHTYFVDPPYEFNYRYKSSLSPLFFSKLGQRCVKLGELGHQVIACEAIGKNGETPTYLPFVASHSQVTSRRKTENSHHSKELVWISNGKGAE
jgi:hypothetical protein